MQTGVAVIGAGFAGLAAALAIEDAGLPCRLVEARNRPGGRVRPPVEGRRVVAEPGAQVLNEDMTALQAQMSRFGHRPLPVAPTGEALAVGLDHAATRFDAGQGPLGPEVFAALAEAVGDRDQAAGALIDRFAMAPVERRPIRSSPSEPFGVDADRSSGRTVLAIRQRIPSALPELRRQASSGLARLAEGLAATPRAPPVPGTPLRRVEDRPQGPV